MPRCCQEVDNEFAPCYASVLVAGSELETRVKKIEESTLCHCVTTWCSTCSQMGMLITDMHRFKCPSAYYAHMLVLYDRMLVS